MANVIWDDKQSKPAITWDDASASKDSVTNPSIVDALLGSATTGDYLRGRVNAAKKVVDPRTWKEIGYELTHFPTQEQRQAKAAQWNALPEYKRQEEMQNAAFALIGMSPVTQIVKGAGVPATRAFTEFLKPVPVGANAIKQKTLEMAGEAGFSVPRSNIEQTFLTNLGERFGGKQAIEATAQMKNQPIINKLATKALGLKEGTPITPELLQGIRQEAGKAYDAVSKVGTLTADKQYATELRDIALKFSGASKDFPELANEVVGKLVAALKKHTMSSEGAVEMIKNLRQQASANLRGIATPQEQLIGRAQRASADALENLIERNIVPVLGQEMLNSYRAARQLIAKTHTVENALNESTGNVVGTALVRAADKGAPLTNELKKIADFARAFPRLSREPIGAPASGGLFEPMVYGTAGSLATGPVGAASAAIPIIGKPIARHLMTTVPTTAAQRAAPKAIDNYTLQRLIFGLGN